MSLPPGATQAASADLDVPPLAGLLGRLHRALRRRVRESSTLPALPQSQVEVVRLLHHSPGLRVGEVSAALGLAPNTTSTLIQQLRRIGYIERQVDAQDRRSARLVLKDAALARVEHWRDLRGVVLADALDALPTTDRALLLAAIPALERLADSLEAPSP